MYFKLSNFMWKVSFMKKYLFLLFFLNVNQDYFACCDSLCKCIFPCFSKETCFSKEKFRILMLGFDESGKTTILYQLKNGQVVKTSSTIGFNVEALDYKGIEFTVWDVGGKDKIRVLWQHYYQNTDGLIFVVDSSDKDRIEDAAKELKKMLAYEELKDCPVLVMANKQDLNGALPTGEVTEKLGMMEIKGRTWLVQGTSATTRQGLKEGLDWMADVLLKKKEKEEIEKEF